jgi:hypothetical protein
MGESDLSIDNIDMIACKEDSKLDDSSINNFMELVNSQSYIDQINNVKEEIIKELSAITA